MKRCFAALIALLPALPSATVAAADTLPDVPLRAWVTLDAAGRASRIEWEEPTLPSLQAGAEPLLRALHFSAASPGTADVRTHLRAMLRLRPEGEDVVLHLEAPGTGPKLRRILPPRYPGSALRARQEAHLIALFDVGPTGQPTAVEVQSAPGTDAFATTVREALQQWRFEPEQRAGQPIVTRLCAPFRFTLVGRDGEPDARHCPPIEGRVAVAGEVRPLAEVEVTASRASGRPRRRGN